jgi:hypothetical protein
MPIPLCVACAGTARFEPPSDSYMTQTAQVEGDPTARVIASIDSTFFGGTAPLLGRSFVRDDYTVQGDHVALISFAFWHERFAARPDVIGTRLQVDGVPRVVVGILPQSIDVPEEVALWIPRVTHSGR